MYARVSTYQGSAEDYDRGIKTMESEIMPQVRDLKGYKGIISMVDRSTGQSLSITLWESEEAMADTREDAKRVRSEAATSTGSAIVGVTEYEVGIADLL